MASSSSVVYIYCLYLPVCQRLFLLLQNHQESELEQIKTNTLENARMLEKLSALCMETRGQRLAEMEIKRFKLINK